MRASDYFLGFIGFGHMAQAMFRAMEFSKLIPRSQVRFVERDAHKAKESEREFGVSATTLAEALNKSDVLVLCVRPEQLSPVLEELARFGVRGKKIVSVAAGVSLSVYERFLGEEAEIIRAMPNIAVSVGRGVTLLSFRKASREFLSFAHLFFSSMGEAVEIEEKVMDIGTAMGGSGPGFVFRLIEACARGCAMRGLEYEKAKKIAAQAFLGAAEMVLKGGSLEALIAAAATPRGTTEAGFHAMAEQGIERGLQEVLFAAERRSREIADKT